MFKRIRGLAIPVVFGGMLGLLLFYFFIRPASGGSFLVTVKVLDAENQPVEKVEVALFWDVLDDKMTPRIPKAAVTDAKGKVELRVDNWNEKRPVMALTADRKHGGIVGVSKADAGKEITIPLGPTVKVKAKLESKELGRKLEFASNWVHAEGFRPYFIDHRTASDFEFWLPAGEYTFQFAALDTESIKKKVTLTADRSELDLGTFDLPANAMSKLKGKPFPDWSITDARGVKADVKISDYKGKWVYLEFWGFW